MSRGGFTQQIPASQRALRTEGAVQRERRPHFSVHSREGRLSGAPAWASQVRSPPPGRGRHPGAVAAASWPSGGGNSPETPWPALLKAPPVPTTQPSAPRHPWAVHVLTAAEGLRRGWARRRRKGRCPLRPLAPRPPAARNRLGLPPFPRSLFAGF